MANKKSFLQGALILGVAGLIIKALGAFFRIPLANIIGDDGMGYYQTAYPIYVLFLTLSTAGIPTAISKMVAERNAVDNPREAHRIFRVSFLLLFGIGIVSSAILFFGAEMIVGQLKNPDAKYAMMAIAPALLFVPLMAAYRGYFQGMQKMEPTAASQVAEQLFRVVAGLSLALALVPKGLEYAAAGASFGATAGAVGGLLFVVLIYCGNRKKIHRDMRKDTHKKGESASRILMHIFIIAVPITIGAAIMPIMNTIDVGIVMRRLQESGFTKEAANSLYGQLTGMAGPLINFPQVLTQAIAMSLVPAVAAAHRKNDTAFLHYNISMGLRTAMMIGLPCALGLMILSEPIMLLLYPAQKASAASAAPCLFVLAIGVVFLSSVQTTTGILQGVGKQMVPVVNLFFGAIVKVILTYTLTGIESINVRGAAIGTVAAYIVASALNVFAVRRYTGVRFDIMMTWVKPLISALVMGGVVWLTYSLLSGPAGNAIATLLSVFVGGCIYAGMLFLTKSVTAEELTMLPGASKLARITKKAKKK